ncbi:MAG TPA: tetratricopeptide repeat protein [Candidatus Acidoferrales bacterium]|nr:tetratricopeptide repeat protein [Candidatus Acidoferrales bacterium]
MAKHISRQELKTDQVQEALSHSAEAVLSHKTALIYVVVVALIVAAGVFGWQFYSQRQSVKAAAAFNNAIQIFQAPTLAAGQAPQPNEISYSDSSKRYQDALKKFEDVANQYPRTRSGQLADYYSALCLERLNQNAQAITRLSKIKDSSNRDFAAMARFELAQIYDHSGNGNQAVQLYNELLKEPSVLAPKPMVMLALAEHYRQSDPTQAARILNQIKSEYPDTGAADQADQELALLPAGKS